MKKRVFPIWVIFVTLAALSACSDAVNAPKESRYWLGEARPVSEAPIRWKQWQDDGAGNILLPPTLNTQPAFAQLEYVQALTNRVAFRSDQAIWGVEDYWASPGAFFAYGGDCEDYALAKMSLLRRLGWTEDHLRLVLVLDTWRGIEHAVLWVRAREAIYLLDNQTRTILDAEKQTRYLPRYAMNQRGFWRY